VVCEAKAKKPGPFDIDEPDSPFLGIKSETFAQLSSQRPKTPYIRSQTISHLAQCPSALA
jgi:hypothetical protein